MATLLRVLIILYGVMFIVVGAGFFVGPTKAAASFALQAAGTPGLAVLRADFPAFFIGNGAFAVYGAIRQRAGVLAFPLVGLAIAISGRAVSLAADGFTPGALTPMAIEALGIALLAAGSRGFGART